MIGPTRSPPFQHHNPEPLPPRKKICDRQYYTFSGHLHTRPRLVQKEMPWHNFGLRKGIKPLTLTKLEYKKSKGGHTGRFDLNILILLIVYPMQWRPRLCRLKSFVYATGTNISGREHFTLHPHQPPYYQPTLEIHYHEVTPLTPTKLCYKDSLTCLPTTLPLLLEDHHKNTTSFQVNQNKPKTHRFIAQIPYCNQITNMSIPYGLAG